MILTKGGNANLAKCSSRHCLQNLCPHLVRIGSFNGKWHIAHWQSCSTSFTNTLSYPPSEGYAPASAIIQRTGWVDHEMTSVESIVTCTTKCHAKPALLCVLVVSSVTEGPWGLSTLESLGRAQNGVIKYVGGEWKEKTVRNRKHLYYKQQRTLWEWERYV